LSQKKPKKKEEIVELKLLKGGCDVFFCDQYSHLTKARKRDAAEPVEGRGASAGMAHVWDLDAG
jgi:hypothetical protein